MSPRRRKHAPMTRAGGGGWGELFFCSGVRREEERFRGEHGQLCVVINPARTSPRATCCSTKAPHLRIASRVSLWQAYQELSRCVVRGRGKRGKRKKNGHPVFPPTHNQHPRSTRDTNALATQATLLPLESRAAVRALLLLP